MKSKRHVHLSLGMTDLEFRELLTTLSLAPESCPYARDLSSRLYEAKMTEPDDLMLSYEEESEQMVAERGQCDEPGCENPVMNDEEFEGPDGMCRGCHERFMATHHFVQGYGPGTGWVSR